MLADAARLSIATGSSRVTSRLLVCKVAFGSVNSDGQEAVPEFLRADAKPATEGRLWDGIQVGVPNVNTVLSFKRQHIVDVL